MSKIFVQYYELFHESKMDGQKCLEVGYDFQTSLFGETYDIDYFGAII